MNRGAPSWRAWLLLAGDYFECEMVGRVGRMQVHSVVSIRFQQIRRKHNFHRPSGLRPRRIEKTLGQQCTIACERLQLSAVAGGLDAPGDGEFEAYG